LLVLANEYNIPRLVLLCENLITQAVQVKALLFTFHSHTHLTYATGEQRGQLV